MKKQTNKTVETTILTIILPDTSNGSLTSSERTKFYDELSNVLEILNKYKTALDEQLTLLLQSKLVEGSDSIQLGGFELKLEKRAYKKALKPLEELHDEVFVKEEKKLVIDTKAITDYVKKNGKLPEGFVETVSTYPRLNRIVS